MNTRLPSDPEPRLTPTVLINQNKEINIQGKYGENIYFTVNYLHGMIMTMCICNPTVAILHSLSYYIESIIKAVMGGPAV